MNWIPSKAGLLPRQCGLRRISTIRPRSNLVTTNGPEPTSGKAGLKAPSSSLVVCLPQTCSGRM